MRPNNGAFAGSENQDELRPLLNFESAQLARRLAALDCHSFNMARWRSAAGPGDEPLDDFRFALSDDLDIAVCQIANVTRYAH